MGFDPYFKGGWKSRAPGRAGRRAAIRAKYSWPEGSQSAPKVKIEMRGCERPDWWHFMDAPEPCVKEELEAWHESNPGYEFRAETPPAKREPAIPRPPKKRASKWERRGTSQL